MIMIMSPLPEQRETNRLTRTSAPGEAILAQPWSFITLALTMGVAAGLLLRVVGLRRALRILLLVRRFV